MTKLKVGGVAVMLWLCAHPLAAADGASRLVDAVKRENVQAVRVLLQQGADANLALGDGATALHWAAYLDQVDVAGELLRAKARVNTANNLGVTPLGLACANGSTDMVARLLDAGADPNQGPAGGETPMMTAARVGNVAVMQQLLAHRGNPNARESYQGQTALMWAAAEGHSDVVRLLVQAGADVKVKTNRQSRGRNRREGDADAAPAAPGASTPHRGNGFTALLFAARDGDLESARVLLDAGADANDVAADGMSALVFATVRGFLPLALELLERGANPNLDGAGYAALHWAVGTWESEMTVRSITIDRAGEFYTVAGLREGKHAFVKALLAHGADPNIRVKRAPLRAGSSKNPGLPELEGATPLILAAMAGEADIMRSLVAAGADIGLTTKAGGTVLMAAAGLGHVQGEDFIKDSAALAAATAALDLGASLKATDDIGSNALHYASYMRHDPVVRLLVERGVPLDGGNTFGETPLWTAGLVMQFAGGGIYQQEPSSTSALLQQLGAQPAKPKYGIARPLDWPNIPRSAADQVEGTPKPVAPAR